MDEDDRVAAFWAGGHVIGDSISEPGCLARQGFADARIKDEMFANEETIKDAHLRNP